MEARVVHRYIKQSPRKIRKTLDSIRGKNVGFALSALHFSPEKAAETIEKALHSAIANMMVQADDKTMDPESLNIKEAYVDGGPVMKRFRAASMGRASRLRRPSAHLTIVVSDEK